MPMALHPTLVNILHCELARVLDQTAELKTAMKLHQAQMEKVCQFIIRYSRRSYKCFFVCKLCKFHVPSEFDMRLHRGRCIKLVNTGRVFNRFQYCPFAEAYYSTFPCV